GVPDVHMTPDPTAQPTAEPQPAPGALLFGGNLFVPDEALAELGLPEMPEIEHAAYVPIGSVFTPDEFATMLWGNKWTLDDGGNYVVRAEDNPFGDFAMTGAFSADGYYSVYSSFPAEDTDDAFVDQDEAYEAARAWLCSWLPDEPYLETLSGVTVMAAGAHVEQPHGVYASWNRLLEPDVWVDDCYVTVSYIPKGPESLEMAWREFEPANYDPVPALLTAAQAIDAFNDVYMSLKEEEYNGLWDSKQGYIMGMSAVYSNRFGALGAKSEYRFAWEIVYTDAGKNAYHMAYVDGVTGAVYMDDRVFSSVYTPEDVAKLIDRIPAAQGVYMDGELLWGESGYRLAEDFAHGLPDTPRLEHAYYARERDALDGDTVARWLLGDNYAKETYDFGAVYIREAKKNVTGDFKVKAYVFDDDNLFHWTPDDPSKLYVGEFKSREAALTWAEEWLEQYLPESFFAHPSHPGQYYMDGKPVNTVYGFRWDTQVEGVAVRGAGLSGEICTFGPSFFLLDLGRYLPVEGEDAAMPAYLTSAQAVDALNWAAAQEFQGIEESGMDLGDSVYGTYEDTIESVRPVFANGLFYRDTMYRLCWEIVLRSAERGTTYTFIVDAESGGIWNDHDGAANTIYTR
ncbi:MAG: hypothetical protein IJ048_09995, partial [Clostridia bacterium]|nr:hypothetical protein [Clostridia bacterium]